MELQNINNFVQTANEEQLKAFGFLGQWPMENVSKYCTYTSKFNQNCEITKAPGGALQNAGQRLLCR